MRLFTYMDYVNGACVATEIDTPWQARWSKTDLASGLCETPMVGQSKQPTGEQPEDRPPPLPLTRQQRKAKLQAIADSILELVHQNPSAALGDSGSTVNKLLDLASRLDEDSEALRIPATDDHQGWLALLRQLTACATGVPTDRQCTPLLLLSLVASDALGSDLLKAVLVERNPQLARRHNIAVEG